MDEGTGSFKYHTLHRVVCSNCRPFFFLCTDSLAISFFFFFSFLSIKLDHGCFIEGLACALVLLVQLSNSEE